MYSANMLGMWWTMMIAMMLPGVITHVKWLSLQGTWQAAGFILGYCGIWFLFSISAVILQFAAEKFNYLHPMYMWSMSTEFSVTVLIGASAYQFSPMKQAALKRCNSRHPIYSIHYGRHCLTASGPLMMLLFVGGVMNLIWILCLSAVVTTEKKLPHPRPFSFVVGAAILILAIKVVWTEQL